MIGLGFLENSLMAKALELAFKNNGDKLYVYSSKDQPDYEFLIKDLEPDFILWGEEYLENKPKTSFIKKQYWFGDNEPLPLNPVEFYKKAKTDCSS